MTTVGLFIALGVVVVAAVLFWVFWTGRKPAEPGCDRGEAAGGAAVVLPPLYLIDRIFAAEDFRFVFTNAPPQVQRLFVEERKALALLWLAETRGKVREAFVLYRRVARRCAGLQFSVEGRIALKYVLIEALALILAALVWLWGPLGARRIVGYSAALAEELAVLAARASVELRSCALRPTATVATNE